MKISNASLARRFAHMTDAELRARLDILGTLPHHRVKRTGMIKLEIAKSADRLMAEMRRRGVSFA